MNNAEIDALCAYDGALGTNCTETGTAFRVWAPFAESAQVRFYGADGAFIKRASMHRRGNVFECRVRGDLDGVLYTFAVEQNGGIAETADPYAKRVTEDGRFSVCVDMRRHSPKNWASDRAVAFPDRENAIICELSVRDISSDESADFKNRGKFTALCETKVTNAFGESAGLSYVKKLGATHIQLMPIFDYNFKGGYNWGYDPRFYNAVCASYSQTDGIRELRSLIQTAHKNGIGVVMDVVYNHVFDAGSSAFQTLVPDYYFRRDERTGAFSNGSGCGNEFACERAMARKFIADSLVFWAREYHLDGFRFDLMGLIDIETLKTCERKLRAINPDILLYGEGWTGGASPLSEKFRAVQSNACELRGFAFFNDSFRDAVKGSVFNAEDCGYVNGAADDYHFQPISSALSGEYPQDFWTDDPRQTVNYVECHDNLTLFDKLKISLKDPSPKRVEQAEKMAAALTFLSRGIVFFQAGQDFLRSKNGECNSYNLPDSVNSIKWNALSENREIAEYYRGLIAFRGRFLPKFGERAITPLGGGFMMTAGEFFLLVSPNDEVISPPLSGKFEIYADAERASRKPLYTSDRLVCDGFSILLARRIK